MTLRKTHALTGCLLWAAVLVTADQRLLAAPRQPRHLVLCCSERNDVLVVLKENGIKATRVERPEEAIGRADEGAGVLILADGYPQRQTQVGGALFEEHRGPGVASAATSQTAAPALDAWRPRSRRPL